MTKRKPSPMIRVVGIGASAGGLEALKQLLASVPADTGMAFVILQHLAASQTGVLRAALASSTAMPVVDIATGMRLRADHVHVVPPQVDVALLRGALLLRAAKPGERTLLPIDAMLRSFADDDYSIGVVLSGNANDGSEGLRALRASGGLTFVQDPATAQFDEMPRNAIAAGGATFVLAPADIGAELGRLAREPAMKSSHAARIIYLLRRAIGIDFTEYKRPTIDRRIAHRMQETGHTSIEDYAAFLEATPAESAALGEDLLIHVTQFFREPATLDALVSKVFPQIIASLPAGDAIRVWVPGCSTGQEAYSLAILLTEFLEGAKQRRKIQIFGTDLSEQAIETARAGQYSDAISKQLSVTRLQRFFTRSDGGFRISKAIRDSCVFVRHDVTCDPPFAKLDLVSCRNLLIYLGTSLQQGVIPMIHYALNQPGFLVLGRAESVVGFDTLFSPIDGVPIFARQATAGRAPLRFAIGHTGQPLLARAPLDRVRSTVEIQRDVDHVLLARYSPACVLVDANGDIRQYRGRTGPFLEPAPGLPHHNIYKMARGGVGSEIRAALGRAQREDRAIRSERVAIREEGETRYIDVEVLPLLGLEPHRHFIVVFEESKATARKSQRRKRATVTASPFGLAHELAATKEYLQSALTQHATANEELGLANEELQSINEEMHSTNEELQTAKEELQSANEELVTVNDELRNGNERLEVLNSDLVNVLAAIDVAVIILDLDHNVRRFTPRACSIINFIPSDVGRRIGDLQATVELGDLDGAITRVIESLIPYETEVRGRESGCYRLQIRPYRTETNKIDGVVLAFVDITALRSSVEEARVTRDYAEAVVDTVPSPLAVLDVDQRIRSANRAFCEKLGTTNPIGRSLLELAPGRWLAGGSDLERALATRDSFDNIVVERETADDTRILVIGARVFSEGPPLDRLLLVAMLDITDRIRADQLELGVIEQASREKDSFLNAVSHELRTPLNAILLWTNLLRQGPLDDMQHRQAVETIEHSARAEARLVDDLLDLALSRTPHNGLAITIEQIDPAPLVEAALDAVRADAVAKRIAIEVVFGSNLRVSADPRRLQQIAWNLAANAVKFTPDGGRISVSLSSMRDSVELRVSDNGVGITSELIPRVFEPFWQADQSSTRTHPGLGIGLALVRHLVERQGGTIRVESDGEGTGATFAVQLPNASA